MNNNLYLYILMRTDLGSMGPGRAAAQASHAANAFIHKFGMTPDVKEWAAQTKQGFGTAIVLGTNLIDMVERVNNAYRHHILSDLVIDPDYAITVSAEVVPFIDKTLNGNTIVLEQSATDKLKYILHRAETTCGYIFGDKDSLKELVGNLPLYS